MVRARRLQEGQGHKVLQNLPQRRAFFDSRRWCFGGGLHNIGSLPSAARRSRPARAVAGLAVQDSFFQAMKRNCLASALAALLSVVCAGQIGSAWARAPLPLTLAQNAPPAPGVEPAEGLGAAGGEAPRDFPRSGWRGLSPAQREAIRRLSQEEREALINRGRGRLGGAAPSGARLSPQERRHLREQIREEHERRGGGFGRGRRP